MKKYRFLTIATVLLILFFCREKPIAAIQDNQRPNIIVIMSDDMGYSDIGCYGGDVNTPNKPNTIAIEPSTGVSDSFIIKLDYKF